MTARRRRGIGSFFIGLLVGIIVVVGGAAIFISWFINDFKVSQAEELLELEIFKDQEIKDKNLKDFAIWLSAYLSDSEKLTLESIDKLLVISLPDHAIVNKIKNIPISKLVSSMTDIIGDMMVSEALGAQTGLLEKFNDTKIKDAGDTFTSLTLGDITEISETSPKILRSMATVQIRELSARFSSLTLLDMIDDPNDDSMLSKILNENVEGEPVRIDNIHIAIENTVKNMTVSEFCQMIGSKMPPSDIENKTMFDFLDSLS